VWIYTQSNIKNIKPKLFLVGLISF
jgi:hypothetical protein